MCTSDGDEEDEDDDVSVTAAVVAMVPRVIWEVRAGLRESDVPRITHLLQQEAQKHGRATIPVSLYISARRV